MNQEYLKEIGILEEVKAMRDSFHVKFLSQLLLIAVTLLGILSTFANFQSPTSLKLLSVSLSLNTLGILLIFSVLFGKVLLLRLAVKKLVKYINSKWYDGEYTSEYSTPTPKWHFWLEYIGIFCILLTVILTAVCRVVE